MQLALKTLEKRIYKLEVRLGVVQKYSTQEYYDLIEKFAAMYPLIEKQFPENWVPPGLEFVKEIFLKRMKEYKEYDIQQELEEKRRKEEERIAEENRRKYREERERANEEWSKRYRKRREEEQRLKQEFLEQEQTNHAELEEEKPPDPEKERPRSVVRYY